MSNENLQKANRRKFLLLLVLMCSPVVVSYLLYFSDYRPNSKNYGDLIKPIVKLQGKGTNLADNTILRMKDLHGKWILVTIDSANCSEACKDKLYYMRQARMVQGKERHRIERLWLVNDEGTPNEDLIKEYEGTYILKDRDGDIINAIETRDTQTKHIYLIDPIGNLMLKFPENVDGTKMGQDLKRLLHVSQIEH